MSKTYKYSGIVADAVTRQRRVKAQQNRERIRERERQREMKNATRRALA